MKDINITDIVKLKGDDRFLYMVVDIADFTKTSEIGEKPVIDIDYEVMQIYPIQKNSSYITFSHNDIEIAHKMGDRNHELTLRFIQKDREKLGWFGVPDFVEVANKNLQSIRRVEKASMASDEQPIKEIKMPTKRLDIIRYDIIETIDGCLDALNHLQALYEMFGDEAYLQLKEVVTSRIIRLSK